MSDSNGRFIEPLLSNRDYNNLYIDYGRQSSYQRNNPLYMLGAAKAHFMRNEFETVLKILDKVPLLHSTKVLYERQALLFKSVYLLEPENRKKLESILSDYESNKSKCPGEPLTEFHDSEMKKLLEISQKKKNTMSISVAELEAKLKKYQSEKIMEGLPCFLISHNWNEKFLKFIKEGDPHPGPITNFELINHTFELEPHLDNEKKYLNTMIFPLYLNEHFYVVSKNHWIFIESIFGGNPIKRYHLNQTNPANKKLDTVTPILILHDKKSSILQFQNGLFMQRSVIPCLVKAFEKGKYNGPEMYAQLKERMSNGEFTLISALSRIEPGISTLRYIPINTNELKATGFKEQQIKKKIIQNYDLEKYSPEMCRSNTLGLVNLKNTCYMNSALQLLANIKSLSDFFLDNSYISKLNISESNKEGSYGEIACVYAELIKRLLSSPEYMKNIDPTKFKEKFSKRYSHFENFEQQDAQEFLMFLLNCLHEDLNENSVMDIRNRESTTGKEFGIVKNTVVNHYNRHNKSIISDLFHGFQYEEIICDDCGYKSLRFEYNLMVHVQVSEDSFKTYIFIVYADKMDEAIKTQVYLKGKKTVADIIVDLEATQKEKNEEFMYVPFIYSDNLKKCEETSSNYEVKNLAKLEKESHSFFIFQVPKPSANETIVMVTYSCNSETKKQNVNDGFPRYMKIEKEMLGKEEELQEFIFKKTYSSFKYKEDSKSYIKSLKKVAPTQKNCSYSEVVQIVHSKETLNFTNRETSVPLTSSEEEVHTLQALLERGRKKEKIEGWQCEKCKNASVAHKTDRIYSTGKYLIIQLKRFTENGKIKTKISYPLTDLDMNPFVESEISSNRKWIYNLKSVILHCGSLDSGHYTCFNKKNNTKNEWLHYDDEFVRDIDSNKIVDADAYILLYELSDVGNVVQSFRSNVTETPMNGALPRRSYGLGIGLGNNNYPISSYNNSSNEMNVNGHF